MNLPGPCQPFLFWFSSLHGEDFHVWLAICSQIEFLLSNNIHLDETTDYISVLLKPLVVGFTLHVLARSHTWIWGVGLRHTHIHYFHILTEKHWIYMLIFLLHTFTVDGKHPATTQGVRKGAFSQQWSIFIPPWVVQEFFINRTTPLYTRIFSSSLFRLLEVFNFMEKYGMPDRPKTPECLVIGVWWWIVLRFIQERVQC